VLATPTLLASGNKDRVDLGLCNNGAVTVYIGYLSTLSTSASSWPLAVGEKESDNTYFGDVYGIVATGTCEVIVREK